MKKFYTQKKWMTKDEAEAKNFKNFLEKRYPDKNIEIYEVDNNFVSVEEELKMSKDEYKKAVDATYYICLGIYY